VQDVLARLDVAVDKVLAALDRAVGAGRYVVGFSADHGVAPLPEQAVALGLPAGRLSSTAIRRAVETAVTSVLGPGSYVAGISGPNIYLQPDVVARLAAIEGGARRVEDALLGMPGIASVYWASALAATTPTSDAGLAAARLSYVPVRSGDLVYTPLPYWMAQSTGTTHGTPYAYDQRVPVVFFGAGVRPGRYFVSASPLDLAPTLAALAGVTMPQARGRVLRDGLR
jgi:arylsulfatase A-like enzyme